MHTVFNKLSTKTEARLPTTTKATNQMKKGSQKPEGGGQKAGSEVACGHPRELPLQKTTQDNIFHETGDLKLETGDWKWGNEFRETNPMAG